METGLVRKSADNGAVSAELPKGEVRVSVRSLVEFILRGGDIDNRHQTSPENAMQEGSRIHRMIQKRMGADYQSEVFLRYTHVTEQYTLVVEGRADGVIDSAEEITIDEIKGTYRDLTRMREPVFVHVAQAKCYAYMYALLKMDGDSGTAKQRPIKVRMTYCNIDTEDIHYFYQEYTFEELSEWFQKLIAAYRKWADYIYSWRNIRQESIEKLQFPFPYREGQKELASYVYQTIFHKRKLFLEAPTGVGKTISTVFPAVKAMGRNMGDKLFYLTAKTITRTVADDTIEILRGKGLRFKSVILTAKEKICFMEKTECNPEHCPFAKGHFDRINDAMFDLLTNEESFSREKIEEYAYKHQVCPFEMCLDMSLFADGIICDYNYLFDPHVYLKRFFGDGSNHNYLFLIDEAHNLLDRGREMYSAALVKEDFLALKLEIKKTLMSEMAKKSANKGISGQLTLDVTSVSGGENGEGNVEENVVEAALEDALESVLSTEKNYTVAASIGENEDYGDAAEYDVGDYGDDADFLHGKGKKGYSIFARKGYGERLIQQLELCNKELLSLKRECVSYRLVESIDGFVNRLMRLYATLADYLEEQEEAPLPIREELLDFYFEVSHFLDIYELVDEHYVKYTQLGEDGSFMVKLFCVNPCENLKECMQRGRSTILFSATFLPIQYYKSLLGGTAEDYEVYAKSVFNPAKKGLFIASDVTSKYTRRSQEEYYNIAKYIDEVVKNRHGNYMVFCPSYAFLQTIYDIYVENFAGEEKDCVIQQEYMSEGDREDFLDLFRGNEACDLQADIGIEIDFEEEEPRILIGFCVLGGIFSEGIDLKNDSLIGAIIVGTGLPQVCWEREILKNYFDENGDSGFDYSYRYPGMNKVLQAAGRVIRTMEDVGLVVLLDERFLQNSYRKMFPREWERFETVSVDTVAKRVERFWDSWL